VECDVYMNGYLNIQGLMELVFEPQHTDHFPPYRSAGTLLDIYWIHDRELSYHPGQRALSLDAGYVRRLNKRVLQVP
jgi:hypothetical protein